MDTSNTTWRKSTRSGSQSNCVELANSLDAVRDSKNAEGPVLRVDLGAFLNAVKDGLYGA
jgi:Domain of unknown function (DUF397)